LNTLPMKNGNLGLHAENVVIQIIVEGKNLFQEDAPNANPKNQRQLTPSFINANSL